MQDVQGQLHALRRPPLLIKAARAGAKIYRRDSHLAAALGHGCQTGGKALLAELLDLELNLNESRREGIGDYNAQRHVAVLSALIAESSIAAE